MNAARLVNGILWRMEKFFSRTRIRWFKTLYINFRTLPFSQAIRLPIYIYGHVKFYCLSGKIVIFGPISRGMIKFGYQQGSFSEPTRSAMILLDQGTELIFNGPCMFDFDYAVRLTGKSNVNIGAHVVFGHDVKIYSEESITIGDYCRVAFGSCFIDTNYHYSIELSNGAVRKKSAPIEIGRYNWIGNTSTIMKGTRTPEGTIIASKGFLNKNYVKLGEGGTNIVLAGSPANIVQKGYARILCLEMEKNINEWFATHPGEKECLAGDLSHDYRVNDAYRDLFNRI